MMRQMIALRWVRLLLMMAAICCASDSWATKKPPMRPVNLNTAGSAELQQVPGIGPSTADKILQMRKSCGTFKSVDDLLAIKGIGHKRLEKMRKYLSVGKAGQTKPAASSAPAVGGTGKSAPTVKNAPGKGTPARRAPAEPKVGEEEEP